VALAQNRFPEMAVSPSSSPGYPAVTGDGEYWVVEFDNVWVPVTTTGEVTEGEAALAPIKVHYAIQQMSAQRSKENYPTAQQQPFNVMLSDVASAKEFISAYKGDLPQTLQAQASKMVASATKLEGALEEAASKITSVRAKETKLLNSASSWEDFAAWRTEFSALLDSISGITTQGETYEADRSEFSKQANAYAANEGNDITLRNTATAFAKNTQIPNVPGAFPSLKTTVGDWRASWLDVALSDEKLAGDAQILYSTYTEASSKSDISSLLASAVEKVNALEPKAATLINKLSGCVGELDSADSASFKKMNSSYWKARAAYDEGKAGEKALDYPTARDGYRNAIAFADDASEDATKLAAVACPAAPKPKVKGVVDVIVEFFTSLPGMAVIALALVLAGAYWWNKRKGGEYNEEEYRPAY
jgi:hypothetical protein